MVASRLLLLFLSFACAPPDTGARNEASLAQEAQDSVATAVIPPEGGTIELRGVAHVIFPRRVFDAPQSVTVWTTNFPGTEEGQMDYFLHGGGPPPPSMPFLGDPARDFLPPPLSFDIRISTDARPASGFTVVLTVPEAYLNALPSDHTPEVFAKVETGGPSESHHTYSLMASSFDSATELVRAEVWKEAAWRDPEGRFVVILLLAARPQ